MSGSDATVDTTEGVRSEEEVQKEQSTSDLKEVSVVLTGIAWEWHARVLWCLVRNVSRSLLSVVFAKTSLVALCLCVGM